MAKQNPYYKKNCIVTGGAGFIGQNLVRELVNRQARVYVIDNLSFGAQQKNIHPKAHTIIGDVQSEATFKKLPKVKYDFLFHFAAPSSVILFNQDLSSCAQITIRGFLQSIKFCATNNVRLVFPSTGSLYAQTPPPQNERTKINFSKVNAYSQCKIILENIAEVYGDQVNSLGLRIFAGYGPGEEHKGKIASVLYAFIKDMMRGKSPEIWGDGNQERDFVFIDDLINIMLQLAWNCKEKVVNVGSGTAVSFNQIVKLVNQQLPKKVRPVYVNKPKVYLEKTLADTRLLKKYYPDRLTPIKEGIQKTILYLKEQT